MFGWRPCWDDTARGRNDRGRNIEIIDIECVLLSFLSEKFVSTKWRIYKGILVGPRLLRRGNSRGCIECEFTELFFQLQSLQKNLYRDLKWKKSFTKKKKCLKTHSSVLFYDKQQFWTEYIQKSSFKNKFLTLLCKPKQNPKDEDKLKLNRYVLQIFQLFYNINEVQ
jgi:hypothetical protein